MTRKKRRKVPADHPADLLQAKPLYVTNLGAAYVGDSRDLLRLLPDHSVNAIVTSPPYALHFKKSYGNPDQAEYVDWFLGFAPEFRRILRPKGSLVIDSPNMKLEELEKEYILKVLNFTRWQKKRSSELLGINASTLYRKLISYGLEKPGKNGPGMSEHDDELHEGDEHAA